LTIIQYNYNGNMHKIVISYKIEKIVKDKFDIICSRVHKTRSEYVSELIEKEIERYTKKCARCDK
jgi:metal-responsive CopG/Arc/MetJ family transcriptional regulator